MPLHGFWTYFFKKNSLNHDWYKQLSLYFRTPKAHIVWVYTGGKLEMRWNFSPASVYPNQPATT